MKSKVLLYLAICKDNNNPENDTNFRSMLCEVANFQTNLTIISVNNPENDTKLYRKEICSFEVILRANLQTSKFITFKN